MIIFSTPRCISKVYLTLIALSVSIILSACGAPPIANNPTLRSMQLEQLRLAEFNGVSYHGASTPAGDSIAFLGVPFANAPVGDLRWAKPQRFEAVDSHLGQPAVESKRFAPACMQGEHLANWYKGVIESFAADPAAFSGPEYSENCLYLNIWAPVATKSSAAKKRPVLVFIHGGSNKGGWSYEPNYIGEKLASRDVVVVSIAYRLGVFGYFSHPDLDQANFGLLDQIEALRWIKRNIASVGGDPSNITIAGESAGANNIVQLLASPLATNLFQRAVVQSGGWAMYGTPTKQSREHLATGLVTRLLGEAHSTSFHTASPEPGNPPEQTTLDKLRAVSGRDVLDVASRVYHGQSFGPVIDGNSITKTMLAAIDAGELAKIDLLIGSNANEGLMYVDPSNTIEKWLSENAPTKTLADIKPYLSSNGSRLNHLDELGTAFDFTCPSLMLAKAMSERGGRSWVYQFTKVRDGEQAAEMGAYHGAELPYVFNTHDDWLPTSEADRGLTQSVMAYWTAFMRQGDPNNGAELSWPQFEGQGSAVQILGAPLKSQRHPSDALCAALAN